MLYQYLRDNYSTGEPIFASDIDLPDMSEENLRYHLKKLTDDGRIHRFDAGVYYFPQNDILGDDVALSADTVVFHKYIKRRGKTVGFYSGHTLANRMGLSTQVPYVDEICSNYAPAPVRKVTIGDRDFVVRKPVVEVTDKNYATLQVLDCLKNMDTCVEVERGECGRILTEFASKNDITKSMVNRLLEYYPLKTYKAIYETGVEYASSR